MEVSVILNVMECPSATTARVYPRWWRIVDGVAEVVRVCVDERGRPYTGPAYDPVSVRDDGRWRGPCLALPQYADMFADPWRPGAHDEERLAVGGALQRVVATASETPSALSRASAEVPARLGPAPGAAGMWRPVADYACSGEPTCVFARWLVPVQP